jgi:hypothetical protein
LPSGNFDVASVLTGCEYRTAGTVAFEGRVRADDVDTPVVAAYLVAGHGHLAAVDLDRRRIYRVADEPVIADRSVNARRVNRGMVVPRRVDGLEVVAADRHIPGRAARGGDVYIVGTNEPVAGDTDPRSQGTRITNRG